MATVTGLLTNRQQDVLVMIRAFIKRNGVSPSVREIGQHFGISSPNGVLCHLHSLHKKGAIDFLPNIARGIVLKETFHKCPKCGCKFAEVRSK